MYDPDNYDVAVTLAAAKSTPKKTARKGVYVCP